MDIPALKKHRGLEKASMTRAQTFMSTLDKETTSIQTLQNKRKMVEDHFKRYLEFQQDIEEQCTTDDDLQTQINDREEAEAKYLEVVSKIDELMDEKKRPAQQSTSSSNSSHNHHPPQQQQLKLPEIQIQLFEGKYEDWPSFEDLFLATIGRNTSLSGAQKLQYLKTYTQGDAANLIRSFTITDVNYEEAWNLLKTRYCNKREIVNSIIKKLFHQQRVNSESATHIQALLNCTLECTRSLRVLGRPTTSWDDLLVYLLVDKLDGDTRAEWAKSTTTTEPPTFNELEIFLERHIRSLYAKENSNTTTSKPTSRPTARSHQTSTSDASCSHCNGHHLTYQCYKFLEMNPPQRLNIIQKSSACYNCLRDGHFVQECKSRTACRICSRKHHTLLHLEPKPDEITVSPQNEKLTHTASAVSNSTQVLLKTAIVDIVDSFGKLKRCRALLDDGSEASFMTETCASSLGLKQQPADILITGISSIQAAHSRKKVLVRLHSCHHAAFVDVEAYLLPKVTGILPRIKCNTTLWSHLQGLQLADSQYYNPADIDILLGADVIAGIMREGLKTGIKNTPTAQNTVFGWVLSGKINANSQSIIRSNVATCKIQEILQRFWEVEEPPSVRLNAFNNHPAETHFRTTHSRLSDGRFVVRLPFNEKINTIGSTKEQAMRRLSALEARFQRYPHHRQQYIKFMQEYVELGHMKKACMTPSRNPIYLPHHFVTKEDSSTTKLRVVFDGSAKSSNGISLNDTLIVGPTIQRDLYDILITFRSHLIALKADVVKMYRQFIVHEDDEDCQRILWRENPTDRVEEYALSTVTYGTGSASFQAVRCLFKLAEDHQTSCKLASHHIKNSMYVDDLMAGETTANSAINLMKDLNYIAASGCLQFSKWCSNDPLVMNEIPVKFRETTSSLSFESDDAIKALGIRWKPATDVFTFEVRTSKHSAPTKRKLLSDLARVFDPIGWLSPVTIVAKILLQQLWQLQLDWDVTIPLDSSICQQWDNYQMQLPVLSELAIPRCIITSQAEEYQIHGFCDASEKAYAAAVYLRIRNTDGTKTSNLITSKTKVAPLKQLSIPRLELCAASLLSELVHSLNGLFNFTYNIYCWTDSMVVLKWISSHSRRWKTYVANRVSLIQEHVPAEHWHHVRTHENPADAPSRGITPLELINSSLWWHGPTWLLFDQFPTTSEDLDLRKVSFEEKDKPILSLATNTSEDLVQKLIIKYSSLHKLVSAASYLRRFFGLICNKPIPSSSSITPVERRAALYKLIKFVQQQEFESDISQLKRNNQVSATSNIRQLYPYLDEEGIMRVGGRLQNAMLPEATKHPIILPRSHHLTNIIIRDCHEKNLHAGFTLTMSTLRQNYWILGARSQVKIIIKCCVTCRKIKATTYEQLMGNLPVNRVTPHRPFLHCGVDFAGPFNVYFKRGRGQRAEKCYFAIFVCFSTKACHLEAVTDLSTEAFLACYRRFTSRRGVSSHIYSDCGTNFVGAGRELAKTLKQVEMQLEEPLSRLGTKWSHITPGGPHQGGLWEAGVKSTKHHLKRVIGNHTYTFEQFQTLLCNVEACLNSRPLCALSCDPTDMEVLTPGHFLIGAPLNEVPDPDITTLKEGTLGYWQRVQFTSQHFWKRWSAEYLTSLQQRFKWTQKKDNPSVGDLVSIRDENLPPTRWRIGRIIGIISGKDGLVRTARVKFVSDSTSNPVKLSEISRPIQKLCPILYMNESF